MAQPATKGFHCFFSEQEQHASEDQENPSKTKRSKISKHNPSSKQYSSSLPNVHTYLYPYHILSPPITTIHPPKSASMPLQIQPITARRGGMDQVQPIILTPAQRAVHGGLTPELAHSPRQVFPQLRSLTKNDSRTRPLYLESLPRDYEYVVRPPRPFQNHYIQHGSTPRLPPSPWGGPKKEEKQYPTAYYVEQMEMARPPVGPDPMYQEPLPPKVTPLQVLVMCIWGHLAQWMGMLGSWSKALFKAVVSFVSSVVGFLASTVVEVLKRINSGRVELLILVILIASWSYGLAGPGWDQKEMEIVENKPLYIIRVSAGGGGPSGWQDY